MRRRALRITTVTLHTLQPAREASHPAGAGRTGGARTGPAAGHDTYTDPVVIDKNVPTPTAIATASAETVSIVALTRVRCRTRRQDQSQASHEPTCGCPETTDR